MRLFQMAMVCVVVLITLAGDVQAAPILHFNDFNGGGNQVGQALAILGQTPTVTTHGNFATALASQAWDLVIVDISSNVISSTDSAALVSFIGGGGKVVMSYWFLNSNPTLAAAFNVSVASSISSSQSVYSWDSGHPIFNNPNNILSPITFGPDLLGDNGDKFNVLAGGIAVGGFTSSAIAGQAAIVIGNGGTTIVNGWSFDEVSGANGVNLLANEFSFLLNGPVATVTPEPASVAIWGIGAVGFAFVARRRKLKAS